MPLHHFTRFWATENDVRVIRPVFQARRWARLKSGRMDNVKILPVPMMRIGRFNLYPGAAVNSFSKDGFHPDIVVAHLFKCYEWGWRIAKKHKVPFIRGVHKSDFIRLGVPYARRSILKAVAHADLIVCRSPIVFKRWTDALPDTSPRCKVISSGIDPELVIDSSTLGDKFNRILSDGIVRLITVARLIPVKQIDTLLQALSGLQTNRQWKLEIIGDGPQRSLLESQCKALGLDDKVKFCGWLSHHQVMERMTAAHIFALVSAETLGLVYLEAMARGTIVLAARDWGVDGIITHGHDGFLADLGCTESIAAMLQNLINQKSTDRLIEIAERGVDNVGRRSHETAANEYLQAIQSVMNDHR